MPPGVDPVVNVEGRGSGRFDTGPLGDPYHVVDAGTQPVGTRVEDLPGGTVVNGQNVTVSGGSVGVGVGRGVVVWGW